MDCVINSAANIKHQGKYYDFYNINVVGTQNLIEFCFRGQKKEYNHISTISVRSGKIDGRNYDLFTEYDLDLGQKNDNYYISTKFQSEKLALWARKNGLIVNVFRVGNLMFETTTGKFQENINENSFYNLLKGYVKLGIAPDFEKSYIDFSFIDYTSKAIILLFNKINLVNENHHILNSERISLTEFCEYINKNGYAINILSLNDCLDFLYNNYFIESKKIYVTEFLVFSHLLDELHSATTVEYLQEKTDIILRRLGFKWQKFNEIHAKKMIEYCKEIKFIK